MDIEITRNQPSAVEPFGAGLRTLGPAFAASLIAIVPVVILFATIEKHLVGGLTAGSVK